MSKTPKKAPKVPEGVGVLYVVATPIGNLSDLSPRARQVLSEVPLIASETVQATRRLLSALDIACPRIVSYRDDNAASMETQLLAHLLEGQSAALVSEAGTPAISDPGWEIVAACQREGILVQAVAGPSSLVAALSIAGVACRTVRFLGFSPHQGKTRRDFLKTHLASPETAVLFESPHRLRETLDDLQALLGPDQDLVITRELTKLYEETRRATLAEHIDYFATEQPRGEFVLVLPGRPVAEEGADTAALERKIAFLREAGLANRSILEYLTQMEGLPRNAVYSMINAG